MLDTEVVVIGAGPFGLSISAHLSALGIDHVIVGKAMDSYRTHVPDGMLMKSEPYASTFASPDGKHTVAAYSAANGLDYVDRVGPLTCERFLAYADWYTEKLVPDVRDETVTELIPVDGGFRVSFENAAPILTRQVVVATGVLPYQYLPDELAALPSELVTHAANVHHLDVYKGRKIAVVGAGQSALETAALLHEAGVSVQVIARTPVLSWNVINPAHLNPLQRIQRPVVPLCEGWRCAFWNTPQAFRMLPESYRIVKAKTVLGPSGSWWLRDRVDGVVDVLPGHRISEARQKDGGVELVFAGSGQAPVEVDHVIAGTGFRIDLARLPFMPESLIKSLKTLNGAPLTSRVGQTSQPGLYFAGAPTVLSIGPSARFVAGTHTLSAQLAKSVARSARPGGKAAKTAQQEPAQVP